MPSCRIAGLHRLPTRPLSLPPADASVAAPQSHCTPRIFGIGSATRKSAAACLIRAPIGAEAAVAVAVDHAGNGHEVGLSDGVPPAGLTEMHREMREGVRRAPCDRVALRRPADGRQAGNPTGSTGARQVEAPSSGRRDDGDTECPRGGLQAHVVGDQGIDAETNGRREVQCVQRAQVRAR